MEKPSRPAALGAKQDLGDTIMHTKYRITIVDADELIRELATRWLVGAGHTIRSTPIQALQRGNGLDLIIVSTPNPRNSKSIVQALKADHDSPIILLSARFRSGQATSKVLAHELGVNAVLSTPFTRRQLLEAVAKAMG